MTTYSVCFCFRCRFRPSSVKVPRGIEEVFRKYSTKGIMGVEQLKKFMGKVQGQDGATRKEARDVINDAGGWKHLRVLEKVGLSLDQFFHYLFSEDNCPLFSATLQDMNAPLSHYFIYTDYDSCLTRKQWNSEPSDVLIINALKRGVRVIELDLWPNSKKDDVDVLHVRTMNTPVDLEKCLNSIKQYAFEASVYPVILTLEDHDLTPDLHDKVDQMLKDTLGEMLCIPSSKTLKELLSPEDLKLKILIATKIPKKHLDSQQVVKDKVHEGQEATEEDTWGSELSFGKANNSIKKMDHEENDHLEEEDGDDKTQLILCLKDVPPKERKVHHTEGQKDDPPEVKRLSLSEQAIEKAAYLHGPDLIRFSKNNLVRSSPKATRLSSSNYNPLVGWNYGVQIVALNMQGYGRPLWLNQGMFRANGGCGYVKKPDILLPPEKKQDTQLPPEKKPDILLDSDHIFDSKSILSVKKTLKVKIYTGDGWHIDFSQSHFDKYSPPDFYTRVGIAGVPADTVMERTKVIRDCWPPVWEEEFEFPLTVPALALLRIEVHEYNMDQKDNFGGQTCLPVWELKPGIRCIPLCDRKGQTLPSVKLLMSFEFSKAANVS